MQKIKVKGQSVQNRVKMDGWMEAIESTANVFNRNTAAACHSANSKNTNYHQNLTIKDVERLSHLHRARGFRFRINRLQIIRS